MKFDALGLLIPNIVLPNNTVDMHTWAVVACDQYSSEPLYWEKVEALTAEKPSTAHMIFPEAFLNTQDSDKRITAIHNAMHRALNDGTLQEIPAGLTLCERTLQNGQSRKGVVVALDLEHYDYRDGSQSLIRATEGTIVDRLPPRIKIRQDAPLELPHIMVLIDDPERSVIEPLFKQPFTPLYDVTLMQDGGRVQGRHLRKLSVLQQFADNLAALAAPDSFQKKYATADHKPLLYAMGDGNHSFATARAIWESMKSRQGFDAVKDHPARYALVELVNVYDESLAFEAIHRVVFNIEPEQLIAEFLAYFSHQHAERFDTLPHTLETSTLTNTHCLPFCCEHTSGTLVIRQPTHQLAAGSLQAFLDGYLAQHTDASVDYIHGEHTTQSLGCKPRNIGFSLPPIEKSALFKTVIFDGALPRKTFSMGDAHDKRFYVEARRIQR
ncbi:DUF1015 domain-containing protein [Teredinibacter purpureus]|uniref:DUF1015 domain-containing protein n=1 Tax=Teredinibacter purpureus TaxID=2731756 RepID=UPI0005F7F733|nr:DUF1015 domain-containing protein [Teredinibacter purpureus]